MHRARLLRLVLAGFLFFPGCVVVHDRQPPGRALGHYKHVTHVHVHAANCGHVWHSGRWVVVSVGHVHHRGCGHWYINGRWQVEAPG